MDASGHDLQTTRRSFSAVFDDERARTALLCALASCALVLAFTTGERLTNPMSRMATMDALVHDRAFAIDRSVFLDTTDKVMIGKHYYSSKPPILSVTGAVIYLALHETTGLSFRDDPARAILVMNLILAGIPHLLLLAFAYRMLLWFAPSPQTFVWTYASFAFGHLGLAYATSINNHTPAAVVLLVAFYLAFGLRHELIKARAAWVASGLLAGLAPTLDLSALFVSLPIALYALSSDRRGALGWFAPAALLPLMLHFALTLHITGSLKPIYLRPELYLYPGSYWNAPTDIDALDEPRATYFWNILFGHHGVLVMTPVLMLALLAIARSIVRRTRYRAEALLIGGSFAMLVVFYTLTTKNYGGICVGFRWFMPIVPLSLLFVAEWLGQVRGRAAFALFLACLLVGQYHAYAGLQAPWERSSWERWLAS
jgi:hypothetical protein